MTHGSWVSKKVVESQNRPGVEFVIARMTFGRRIELMRHVRDLAARLEYFEAGRDAKNEMEAGLLGVEIDRLYVRWGLREISGLDLDGVGATPESLAESGPEGLFREAVTLVRRQAGLSVEERKN